jgi:hypothetical protein
MFLYLFKQDWQPTRQTHSHLALTHFHAKATSSKQQPTAPTLGRTIQLWISVPAQPSGKQFANVLFT